MEALFTIIDAVNAVMLSAPMLYSLLAVAVLMTLWSGFSQYRSLTHGFGLLSGRWTSKDGPGVLTHFQALSAALSGTVGLGNIAGVAIAVEIGGPGAVFWMWVVGFFGMALKSAEVMLSMLYRNTADPNNPHGGTMWVASKGLAELSPKLAGVGRWVGGLFAASLLLFAFTGGNMFQAWSVGDTTRAYFSVSPIVSGSVLAIIVGGVIIGGIRRIGTIAATLVPFMCGIYIIAGLAVLFSNIEMLPGIFSLIFSSAFAPAEASGAFVGASFGTAFIFGMKRALFSSEAGLGSAPIAHSAVKTNEPATESVVAGLEPFIDTLVVCTITALVILSSGVWQRAPEARWDQTPQFVPVSDSEWTLRASPPAGAVWSDGEPVFAVAQIGDNPAAASDRKRISGVIRHDGNDIRIEWSSITSTQPPLLLEGGLYADYSASTLTARAFDSGYDGLGKWMVTMAVWLFAISTMITWSYYGEQALVYFKMERALTGYRVIFCGLAVVACMDFLHTAREVDSLSTIAMGFMLAINLPLVVILGHKAITAWRDYIDRMKRGQIHP